MYLPDYSQRSIFRRWCSFTSRPVYEEAAGKRAKAELQDFYPHPSRYPMPDAQILFAIKVEVSTSL
jgi:hypothetical protein